MWVRKVSRKEKRLREFVPAFAIVNGAGEVVALTRNENGAQYGTDGMNAAISYLSTHKYIKIEEVPD